MWSATRFRCPARSPLIFQTGEISRKAMRKLLVSLAAVVLTAGACSVHDTDTPALTGPSTNALTLSVTATPDTIPQNGTAQASIAIRAFNAGGQPYPKLTVRLDMQ